MLFLQGLARNEAVRPAQPAKFAWLPPHRLIGRKLWRLANSTHFGGLIFKGVSMPEASTLPILSIEDAPKVMFKETFFVMSIRCHVEAKPSSMSLVKAS